MIDIINPTLQMMKQVDKDLCITLETLVAGDIVGI